MSSIASPQSVSYLRDLVIEKYGVELPAEQVDGLSQAAISAKINALVADENVADTTDAQREQIAELCETLSITVVPAALAGAANRQIKNMQRQVNSREYAKGASDWEAFKSSLTQIDTEDDASF